MPDRWPSNQTSSAEEKVSLFMQAVTTHTTNTLDNCNGKGCDRLLLALRMLALEDGTHNEVGLFTDEAMGMSSSYKLSTSNITGSGWGNVSEWWGGVAPPQSEHYITQQDAGCYYA